MKILLPVYWKKNIKTTCREVLFYYNGRPYFKNNENKTEWLSELKMFESKIWNSFMIYN